MKKALIIDDDALIRSAVTDLLTRVNFEVDIAEDGWEGVRKARKDPYDLILLDIRMPAVDGEQVLTILHKGENAVSAQLPVVIMSAFFTRDNIIRLRKLGARGFIAKPIDVKNFYTTVDQVCGISGAN